MSQTKNTKKTQNILYKKNLEKSLQDHMCLFFKLISSPSVFGLSRANDSWTHQVGSTQGRDIWIKHNILRFVLH